MLLYTGASHSTRNVTSASSSLNFGVEPLQFHAGVLDAELPVTPILSLKVALGIVVAESSTEMLRESYQRALSR